MGTVASQATEGGFDSMPCSKHSHQMDACVFSYKRVPHQALLVSPKEQENLSGETRVTPLIDAKAVLGFMYLAFADILNEPFLFSSFSFFSSLRALFLRLYTRLQTLTTVARLHIARYIRDHLDRYRRRRQRDPTLRYYLCSGSCKSRKMRDRCRDAAAAVRYHDNSSQFGSSRQEWR